MPLCDQLIAPRSWRSATWSDDEFHLYELETYSQKYKSLKALMSEIKDCTVTSIKRVENHFLKGCYLIKKKEYEKKGITFMERKLLHCTGQDNIPSIVRDNFDWRQTFRGRFGLGVCFSPYADYANTYANRGIGYKRAMIVTKIIIGNCTNGCYDLFPPHGFDTTTGNDDKVLVKYCDYEFYPKYVIYFS